MRGGHEHPDFPFIGFYEHKRYISLYDNNMWVYDGVQPEYLVDIQYPQIPGGTLFTHTFLLTVIFPWIIGMILQYITYKTFKIPYQERFNDREDDNVRIFLQRLRDEQPFAIPHPLGHQHTYKDEGWSNACEHWLYKHYKLS